MAVAMRIERLSKKYTLGSHLGGYGRLTETISELVRHPLRHRNQPPKDELWALRDVSFDVAAGDIVGIIGRNGAGKTTLLKILSRITEPTSGSARIVGRVSSLLEVGTGFHPELTGRENVFLNGAILGMRKTEIARKFDEIVDFAGVERFIDTPVKRYSSGMQVRLAFAVAAHLEPDVLIVDEVLAVGDAEFQKKCLARLENLGSGEGRTVLFVSHNMGVVSALCRRGIVLDGGEVVFDGDTTLAISRYQASLGTVEEAVVDLTEWPGRYGPGELARLTFGAIEDASGVTNRVIAMGSELRVKIGVRFAQPVANPEIGIAVSNLLGQRVSHLVSAWETDPEPVEAGEYTYEVRIPGIPFVPGLYSLTFWVKREGRMAVGSDDGIESAMTFEVTPADVNGRAPYFEEYCQPGEVYIPSEWSLERR